MSALAIILIALAVILLLVFVGGLVGARRREVGGEADYAQHLAEADHALEQARAADRGWDREVMEAAVRQALGEQRPDFKPERLDLVLVDDRPGVTEDRAHFVAASGGDQVRVILGRGEAGWVAESIQ